jgi:hypothetical protein
MGTDITRREAMIREMRNKDDRLVNMTNLIKEVYQDFPLPDLAFEWFARDRLNMKMSAEEIEELKKNIKVEYNDDELSETATEPTEESGGPATCAEPVSGAEAGDERGEPSSGGATSE